MLNPLFRVKVFLYRGKYEEYTERNREGWREGQCKVRELEKARFREIKTRPALYRNRSPLMK